MSMTSCLNLILDEEHAVKLSHLAERTHARPDNITRSCGDGRTHQRPPPQCRGLGDGDRHGRGGRRPDRDVDLRIDAGRPSPAVRRPYATRTLTLPEVQALCETNRRPAIPALL